MRPGITGLWQVEARDNPSFEAYRRLDLFYVENWSLLLDLIILLGTVDHVLVRPFMNRSRRPAAGTGRSRRCRSARCGAVVGRAGSRITSERSMELGLSPEAAIWHHSLAMSSPWPDALVLIL